MDKIRTIIVDDEKKARQGLQTLLGQRQDFEVVKTCKDGVEAVEYLNREDCDLLLLDIQMPAINGFEVLQSVKNRPFTIFITAYDEYALKAFEFHALDYLLKPFTNSRFFEALARAKELITGESNPTAKKLESLLKQLALSDQSNGLIHASASEKEKLVIRVSGKIIILATTEVFWIEADDYYIKIHLENESYMVRESLKGIILKLPEKFIRVHKSAIINTDYISDIEHLQNAEYMVNLQNGNQVKVSRSYKGAMDEFLTGL